MNLIATQPVTKIQVLLWVEVAVDGLGHSQLIKPRVESQVSVPLHALPAGSFVQLCDANGGYLVDATLEGTLPLRK